MTNRVFYFNIDYFCNNRCLFCFSHNVGDDKKQIASAEIFSRLDEMNANENDYIIINGGEPSIHSEFYSIVNRLCKYKSIVKIYSNGVCIKPYNILNKRLRFVIPIHGEERIHDGLTRNKGSFKSTINSLVALTENGIEYDLKFIINKEIIESEFDINNFLSCYSLTPTTIYLCRMNQTKKSLKNNYDIPSMSGEKAYIEKQFKSAINKYNVKFLDFPRCYIDNLIVDNKSNVSELEKEIFFFNDHNFDMVKRNYYKERVCTDKCNKCIYNDECDFMSVSYYVLTIKQDMKAYLEME